MLKIAAANMEGAVDRCWQSSGLVAIAAPPDVPADQAP
jgi:hypothetical protein